MNNRGNLSTAIRGPILLITIGSLIAFDTFDVYSFSRTWPVIVIVLGILKLFERMTDRPQEPTQTNTQPGTGVAS